MGTVGEGWGVERGTVPSSVAKRMVGSVGEGMVRVWGVGVGGVGRERIKPFFLQKTCIIPLSGFFASLFWLFII